MVGDTSIRPPLLTAVALVAAGTTAAAVSAWGPEAGLLVPGLLLAGFILVRPFAGLLLVIFWIPFEAILLFEFGTANKFLAMFVALAWLVRRLLRRESWRPLLGSAYVVVGFLFVVLAWLSSLWSVDPASWTFLLRLAMLFVLGLILADMVRTWDRALMVARALVLGATVAAAITIWQYYAGGVRRAGSGVYGGINSTAMVLVLTVPFGFALFRSEMRLAWRMVGALYVGLAVVAVTTTLSRMALLVLPLLIAAEYWETLWRSRRKLGFVLLTALVLVVSTRFLPLEALTDRIETIRPYVEATLEGETGGLEQSSARGYHLKVAAAVFSDHPVIGVGYRNLGEHFLQYQHEVSGADKLYTTERGSHSSFFGIAADLGLVGLAIWLGLLVAAATYLWKARTRLSKMRESRAFTLVRALLLAFGVEFALGFYDEIHEEKHFWILLGLTLAVYSVVRARSEIRKGKEVRGSTDRERRAGPGPVSVSGPRLGLRDRVPVGHE